MLYLLYTRMSFTFTLSVKIHRNLSKISLQEKCCHLHASLTCLGLMAVKYQFSWFEADSPNAKCLLLWHSKSLKVVDLPPVEKSADVFFIRLNWVWFFTAGVQTKRWNLMRSCSTHTCMTAYNLICDLNLNTEKNIIILENEVMHLKRSISCYS